MSAFAVRARSLSVTSGPVLTRRVRSEPCELPLLEPSRRAGERERLQRVGIEAIDQTIWQRPLFAHCRRRLRRLRTAADPATRMFRPRMRWTARVAETQKYRR
jgi:hypothetical protein